MKSDGSINEIVIKPWIVSRLSLYWIPSIIIFVSLYNYIYLEKINFTILLQNFSYAAVFIFGAEFWLFGEKVILSDDVMRYRKKRWPIGNEITIKIEDIFKIEYVYFSKLKNVKASRLQIHLNGNNDPIDFVFASFKPSEVQLLIKWFQKAKKGPE